jgi:hypothetical protein
MPVGARKPHHQRGKRKARIGIGERLGGGGEKP